MVDFNPRELCYVSIEGLVLLQEVNTYKDGSRTKTFTKIESSVRNLQIDDCLNEAVPIVFGTKIPFRRMERQLKQQEGIVMKKENEQHFIKVWACMSEEKDGNINTKTIEDIEVDILETELDLNVKFLGEIQELLDSVGRLSASCGFLSSSAIVLNMDIVNKLSLSEKVDYDFTQIDLINSLFS